MRMRAGGPQLRRSLSRWAAARGGAMFYSGKVRTKINLSRSANVANFKQIVRIKKP
jgi:hypothetical protein